MGVTAHKFVVLPEKSYTLFTQIRTRISIYVSKTITHVAVIREPSSMCIYMSQFSRLGIHVSWTVCVHFGLSGMWEFWYHSLLSGLSILASVLYMYNTVVVAL